MVSERGSRAAWGRKVPFPVLLLAMRLNADKQTKQSVWVPAVLVVPVPCYYPVPSRPRLKSAGTPLQQFGGPSSSKQPLPTHTDPTPVRIIISVRVGTMGMENAIDAATSVADIHAALAALHHHEASVTQRLDDLVASQNHLSRELARLDLLRAHLGTHVVTTRAIGNGMLSDAASTANRISTAVKRLDHEQANVRATLQVVEQVAELKACVLGVHGSMGAPQDWETAAGYLSRASKIPDEVIDGSFAEDMVPTADVPDPPRLTLDAAAESLCALFLREFDKAAAEADGSRVTRFFKLFPLIGRSDTGLDAYGRYVCQGVAARARTNFNSAPPSQRQESYFYGQTLTKLFEHIAQIVDGHEPLVERHYGTGMMAKVIERLQIEADVQGGIVLDTWHDERNIDRKLTDSKSYAFSFLVQSFKPANGTPRSSSPTNPAGRNSEDESVDMKEIDRLLAESALMLGRWALYSRFISDKCPVCSTPRLSPLLLT